MMDETIKVHVRDEQGLRTVVVPEGHTPEQYLTLILGRARSSSGGPFFDPPQFVEVESESQKHTFVAHRLISFIYVEPEADTNA
jgi:hypothetical protein